MDSTGIQFGSQASDTSDRLQLINSRPTVNHVESFLGTTSLLHAAVASSGWRVRGGFVWIRGRLRTVADGTSISTNVDGSCRLDGLDELDGVSFLFKNGVVST